MSDFLQMSLSDFLAATAAKQPTPGGGSVAALSGALAASLASMALHYTVGKKAFATHQPQITAALARFQTAATMLEELLLEDVTAYEALSTLLKLPPESRAAHSDYIPAVVAAIRAPQTTAAIANDLLQLIPTLVDKTNKMLLSDLGIAAVYAHATVHASELNVRVNLPLLPNQDEAAEIKKSIHDMTLRADESYGTIRNFMLETL
jgi:methenyltetrahydrofolate cyclohydrolase